MAEPCLASLTYNRAGTAAVAILGRRILVFTGLGFTAAFCKCKDRKTPCRPMQAATGRLACSFCKASYWFSPHYSTRFFLRKEAVTLEKLEKLVINNAPKYTEDVLELQVIIFELEAELEAIWRVLKKPGLGSFE